MSRSIPLRTVVAEGRRYVVDADLGLGRPVPLMVHGNARLYLSLTHAIAEGLTGAPVAKRSDYGYSARGRGAIDVPSMRLGGAAFHGLVDVPVFDFTDEVDAPIQGMLGTAFLIDARAAVDFHSDTLVLGVGAGGSTARGEGEQRTVPMRMAEDGRLAIDAFFPAIDSSIAIVPSTVANALTLHRPLFEGRVEMEPAGPDLSPNGTTPGRWTSPAIDFSVGGVDCRADASFEDLAEYGNLAESDLATFGMLGFDWMKDHGALLDYAHLTLTYQP